MTPEALELDRIYKLEHETLINVSSNIHTLLMIVLIAFIIILPFLILKKRKNNKKYKSLIIGEILFIAIVCLSWLLSTINFHLDTKMNVTNNIIIIALTIICFLIVLIKSFFETKEK